MPIYEIKNIKTDVNLWKKELHVISEENVDKKVLRGLMMFSIVGNYFIAEYAFIDPIDEVVYLRDRCGNTAYISEGRIKWCYDTIYSNALQRYRRTQGV